ncbi:Pimeloyl-ACP methyl ester carboxylesterase [Halogranum gelatinilyticum]|uniref:Pimeloyl-ACP methyl ester carboxylesterase n=1 Tax=Halogranum gelatinilyticum TaxID=660521 RepID=A0A1G9PFS8_9EURY|nr:alpha/beta fold hydrolase [Halogranum gelatinilyticum]SDL97712.1 Pimeloyl-ACP methyl ester carboxylesterase [Halogranum gelatinilyticum]
MPTARNGGVSLFYDSDGDGETVAFVGDVGYGAWQWGWQHAAVAGPYESLVLDLRGSGRSDAPDGPYTVGELAQDVEVVLADHGVRKAHLVGAGLGGMVAMQVARSSSRAKSLTLVGTAASGADLDLSRLYGTPTNPQELRSSLDAALSPDFFAEQPDVVDQIVAWRGEEDADRAAWEAQAAAVDGFDISDTLFELTTPTLVLHGTEDAVWPAERGRKLAEGLPRGDFSAVDGAGHLAHVEHSRVVNDRLLDFLAEQADDAE